MGYSTEFQGQFKIDKPLDNETFNLINGLARTRRMARKDLGEEYGVEGEFYYNLESTEMGQEMDDNIIDFNTPPPTQPGLWLCWEVTDDKQHIEWNKTEKFYSYVKWLVYLIDKILKPKGYNVNGEVKWRGDDFDDIGVIVVENNVVTTN